MNASMQTLVVCFLFALWGSGNLYSQAQPSAGCTRTFTSDEDFNEGLLLSVNTSVSGSLRLDQPGQPLPFVYVPCSARGTVVRINVTTGEIVGEYSTAPNGMGKNPSRTTVDKDGNVWVSNRDESGSVNGISKGSVVRVGLVIGGTRCDADGSDNPSGQYLRPPFIFNTCIDRDGDGLIKTSRGLGNILSWTNADGADTFGGVSTADDEAITVYTRTYATGARTLAVDEFGDIWVGGSSNRYHEKLSGQTGQSFYPGDPRSLMNIGVGGYGGLIDGYGVLWSTGSPNNPTLRFDTNGEPFPAAVGISGLGDYGIGVDPNTGEIWVTQYTGNRIFKLTPAGELIGSYAHGNNVGMGLAVDAYQNVWIAHGGSASSIGHLKTDGTYVGNVPLPGNGPIGVAIDKDGKVWTACINTNNAVRIDPNAGGTGGGGNTIGAVDMNIDLGGGAGPYTYSDMTGFVVINATVPSGSWTVLHDGQVAGRKWGKITWNAETPDMTGVRVEARASDDALALALLPFVEVGNGEEFCCAGVTGRYVEIRTTLFRGITVNETPVLYDLTIECCEIYPNEVPSIASSRGCNPTDTLTLPADQPFTMSFFGSDPDADQALTISANVLPAGASLVQDTASTNPVSAVFSWTPTVAQVGVYNITFKVDDIYCYNDLCPKVLEVIPCVPFSIYGVDPLVSVQCLEDKPGFQNGVYAYDECTGFYGEIETWESETGSPEVICSATTAIGPGADWAIWLEDLEESGDVASSYFHFDANGGTFKQFTDGTAHLSGTIENSLNNTQKFVVDFWFDNKADWNTWDSLGRSYKNDLNLACADTNHPEWEYYEMKGGFSTLTGAGSLAGDVLYAYHTPSNFYYGFQVGDGANSKNCNHGMSGWFRYDGFVDGEHIVGNGDVNVDTDCDTVPNNGDCIHNTSFTYFYRSENENGFALIETQQVVIEDTTAPVFENCGPSVVVACEDSIPALPTPTATDNCVGDVTIAFLGEMIDGEGCVRTITRTWAATDLCGNRAECTQVISIADTAAPVLGNLPVAELNVSCDAIPVVAQVTLVDNCDENPTLVYNEVRINGNCAYNYTLVRTWYGVDACENVSSTFTQTIHVADTTAPVVAPYALEVEMPCDNISTTIAISATDNCGNVNITFSDEYVSGACAGRIIRTYYVSDECGNQTPGMIQQIINLIDVTAPTVVSQTPNQTVQCGASNSYVVNPPVFADNCDQELNITSSFASVTSGCTTTDTYTWTATDDCGNSTSTSTVVTTTDNTPPVFVGVPGDRYYDCNDTFGVDNVLAEDNCSDVTITHSDVIVPGYCAYNYTIERTFRAEDECGNFSTYVQLINVSDDRGPVWVSGQTNFTYACGSTAPVVAPTATDNCSEISIDYVDVTIWIDSCTTGFNRVWTAVDACGNSSLPFTQYIIFVDTVDPILSGCPEDLVLECGSTLPAPAQVTAEDNCDDNVQVLYEEFVFGNAPEEGSIADCNLMTAARPAGNPCGYPYDWAMAMFSMPSAHRYYTVENGSLVQYPDSTLHLTATMRNAMNPANGWTVDVWFAGNMDWNTWSDQEFPTSFKADCGGNPANFASWKYFLMTPGANTELIGFGAYAGSALNLVHAPANNYFGYQLGDGANNYNNADNGFGGWFSYNGMFHTSPNAPLVEMSGAGDFALELDCCSDYSVERQWTAIDCSGNATVCSQSITFDGIASAGNGGNATIANEGLESSKLTGAIAVSPNPANNTALFTFKAAHTAKTSLEVFDMTGKKVADVFMGSVEAGASYNVNYNVSDLATGVYTYRLTNGADVKIERLIINK